MDSLRVYVLDGAMGVEAEAAPCGGRGAEARPCTDPGLAWG